MKKTFVALCAVALVSAALQGPVLAGKTKAPVKTTLYFHGQSPLGEEDAVNGLIDLNSFMVMDPKAPEGTTSKSKSLGWSSTNCAGNRLFVTWVGAVSGRITGDMKVSFSALSVPQEVDIRVWPDVREQLCDAKYPIPAAAATVTMPAGQGLVEAVLPDVDFTATSTLMLQISPTPVGTDTPGPGRVFYDSTADPSHVEFSCIPKAGKTCSRK